MFTPKSCIYEKGTSNGVWIDKKIAQENSMLIDMLSRRDSELSEIGLPFSIDSIKLALDVLSNKTDVNSLSSEQLLSVIGVFDYLGVSLDKFGISDPITTLTNSVKDLIIKKYAQDRKKVLINTPGAVTAIAFTPDGARVFSNEEYYGVNKFLLWNISDPNPDKRELVGHQHEVRCIACSSNGKYMVSGSKGNQNNLLLWDMDDLDNPKPLEGHPQDVNAVAFSFDSKYIVSGSDGNQDNLIVWDITNPQGVIRQVLVGHPTGQHLGVDTVAFSPDSTQIISGSRGELDNLILWNMNNWGINHPDIMITSQKLDGHPDRVSRAVFSSDGQKILSVCYANVWYQDHVSKDSILLWDISDLNNIRKQWLDDDCCCFKSAVFSPDGKSVVSVCGHSKNVILWDVTDFDNITNKKLAGHSHFAYCAAFSPDNKRVISGGGCGQYLTGNNLILWNVSQKNNITYQALKGHPYSVTRVQFTPDGKKIISGGRGVSNNLILWTLLTDEEERLLHQVKNYTIDQIELMYRLCSQFLKDQKVVLEKDSQEEVIFKTLPQDMQNLLSDLFSLKGWMSGWWG